MVFFPESNIVVPGQSPCELSTTENLRFAEEQAQFGLLLAMYVIILVYGGDCQLQWLNSTRSGSLFRAQMLLLIHDSPSLVHDVNCPSA